ncbi:MAG: PGPGW domain-containing protein [Pontiellaceae bacterium]|nr:PGPGW domain-containing protein [Pontiellaceae bacterium]MBN2784053.1 PGPGW domain-containing protein [Pontiellaceae bacterium]
MKRLIWNRHTKRVLKHLAGWLCIVGGIVMLVTPGQGLLTIIIGVYLLADEIPLFGRIKDRINHRFPKASAYVHEKGEKLKARFHHNS